MHHEKLTEAVTVKLSDTDKCFAVSRAHQKGMESASEYLRWLLTMDREQARQEYTLLGLALGVNGNDGNRENVTGQSGPDGDGEES